MSISREVYKHHTSFDKMDLPPGGPLQHGNSPQARGTSTETSDNYIFIDREIKYKLPIIYSHWILKDFKTAAEELRSLLQSTQKRDISMFLALFDAVIPYITPETWYAICPSNSRGGYLDISNEHRNMDAETQKPTPSAQFKTFIMHNLPQHLKACADLSPQNQHLCALLESLHARLSALAN